MKLSKKKFNKFISILFERFINKKNIKNMKKNVHGKYNIRQFIVANNSRSTVVGEQNNLNAEFTFLKI